MTKNRLRTNLRLLTLPLLVASTLNAATYDENYDVNATTQVANYNVFMDGDFKEIIRYDIINFDDGYMDDDSQKILDTAIEKANQLEDDGYAIKITILGHTNEPTDNANELSIDSDTYANGIQNWFRYSMDTDESNTTSNEYAQEIQDKMLDANLSQKILFVESRSGLDPIFTDEDSSSRDISNRVMLSIYVEKPSDIDSDRDGIFDKYDRCPATPRGSIVDKNGCPVDNDKDGILDFKDDCPNTPEGILVDAKGCPLDSDKDGVVDYKDKCEVTPTGITVDINGCPLEMNLKLNFARNSDKILSESYIKVKDFANFLTKNSAYSVEIIGHTDSRGKAVKNMDLSQRRAAMTKSALVNEGVNEYRITTKGRGELDPITSNRTKEGRSINRRIEVKLKLKK